MRTWVRGTCFPHEDCPSLLVCGITNKGQVEKLGTLEKLFGSSDAPSKETTCLNFDRSEMEWLSVAVNSTSCDDAKKIRYFSAYRDNDHLNLLTDQFDDEKWKVYDVAEDRKPCSR